MRTASALPAALLGLLCATGAFAADLNDAGRAAYERGDYATAERLFRQAATQSPGDPLVHYHQGVTLMRLARWREAAAAFDTVLRLNPPPDLAATTREGIRSLAPLLREPAPRRARSEEILVTLHRAGGNWLADVRLNDSRTARFVVDTGASACVLSPELATALRIHPPASAEQVPMQVVGGVTAGRRVTIASVRVGDAEVDNVDAIVHSIGPGIDGLLGNTFLGRFTVTLDPAKGVLVLRPR
jgi:clan AA aspartic protease (TIGR02281 family)